MQKLVITNTGISLERDVVDGRRLERLQRILRSGWLRRGDGSLHGRARSIELFRVQAGHNIAHDQQRHLGFLLQ
jgi:hypothetical protein